MLRQHRPGEPEAAGPPASPHWGTSLQPLELAAALEAGGFALLSPLTLGWVGWACPFSSCGQAARDPHQSGAGYQEAIVPRFPTSVPTDKPSGALQVLLGLGDFVAAKRSLRKAHQLGSQQPQQRESILRSLRYGELRVAVNPFAAGVKASWGRGQHWGSQPPASAFWL